MQITLSQLTEQMRLTAEALSTRRINIRWMSQFVRNKPGGPLVVLGFCVEVSPGFFDIGILPGRTASKTFRTFLHECGHAYADPLGLPDREAAADEIADIWQDARNCDPPQNVTELMQRLESLKGYHEKNTCDRLFAYGANAGRLLPSARNLHNTRGG